MIFRRQAMRIKGESHLFSLSGFTKVYIKQQSSYPKNKLP